MQRRDFIKYCAASAAAAGSLQVAADARAQAYGRARLVGADGAPLRARAIPAKTNLIFHYPYASTPCFLLNLGRPARAAARLKTVDHQAYEWRGGVGAGRSIVAYSAICAHKLSYPTRDISFISFRTEKSARNKFADVIHCCSEHSQYDPAEGGRVLAGPAPQPLAAILLEHDPASDELTAVGTLGGEMFNEFFAKYEFRLALDNGGTPRRAVAGSTMVTPLTDYCKQQVKC
ncbi:MAG: twin-arginine translocation signal domain-containing protein [Proteobacteria bacterium]|nr:twin-arginine translocation signal domain-containing protein [Pseudomonadota bacterium]